ARTKNGKDFEPSSLSGILASVERHLSRSSYGKTIFKDTDFKKTRGAWKAKQKQLKRHGLANRPNVTTALTDDEIEILFEKKLLALSSPQALLNTVWLNNMIHFGLRGCKDRPKRTPLGRHQKRPPSILEPDSSFYLSTENNLTAQPLAEYRIASTSTTSSTLDANSFNENRLQTMFHGNYVTGGVFNINLAPGKNEVKSPEVDPKSKKRRLIIESDSSQESTT
ncbi:unnamed protein product, partial [Porites evermanni]